MSARTTFIDPATPLPADVRWMNATASVLFMLFALAVLALALAWLVRQPVFTLRAIRIDGDVSRNSVATIRANAAPQLSGNFFTMDLRQGQAAFESVPWVRRAVVQRVWPNGLAVQLEEHRAAAIWSPQGSIDGATDKLVNTHGEVFQANLGDVEDDALATLTGPDGTSAAMLAMLDRLAPLLAPLDTRIDTLTLSHRGSWQAELGNGATVQLGRGEPEQLAARTRQFAATLAQIVAHYERPLVSADLRHQQGYAVRLRGVSTTLTPADKALKK